MSLRPIECGVIVAMLALLTSSSLTAQSGAALGPLKLPDVPLATPDEPVQSPVIPVETTPVETTPVETTPVETTPVEQAPVEQAPLPPSATTPVETVQPVAEAALAAQPDLPAEATAQPEAQTSSETTTSDFVPSLGLDEPVARSRWAAKPLPGSDTVEADGVEVVSGDGARDALEVGASLAGVIALIYVLRLLIRRARGETAKTRPLSGGRSPSGVASVLARYPIARGQQVVLLGVGQRILVVHQSAGTMSTLSEITDPEEVAQLHAQIAGIDRRKVDREFDAQLTRSLEQTPREGALSPVADLPGIVAETVDLTRRGKARRYSGGAA